MICSRMVLLPADTCVCRSLPSPDMVETLAKANQRDAGYSDGWSLRCRQRDKVGVAKRCRDAVFVFQRDSRNRHQHGNSRYYVLSRVVRYNRQWGMAVVETENAWVDATAVVILVFCLKIDTCGRNRVPALQTIHAIG